MNCTADGRPEPTYAWHDNDGFFSEIVNGPELTITQEMVSHNPQLHSLSNNIFTN